MGKGSGVIYGFGTFSACGCFVGKSPPVGVKDGLLGVLLVLDLFRECFECRNCFLCRDGHNKPNACLAVTCPVLDQLRGKVAPNHAHSQARC